MDSMQSSNLVLAKILQLSMVNGVSHWSMAFGDLELGTEYETFFFPCIEWLEAEGLIRVGTYSRAMGGLANGSVGNIALTSRGMALLGQKVSFHGTEVTLSEAVREVSRGKADYHGIGDAIGGLIGGFVKSVISG